MDRKSIAAPDPESDAPELRRFLVPSPMRRIMTALLDQIVIVGPFVFFWLVTRYMAEIVLLYSQSAFSQPTWSSRLFDVAGWGTLVSLPLMICLQIAVLLRRDQTLGMRLLGTKVVRLDGRRPGFVRLVLLRVVATELLVGIPVLGWIVLAADVVTLWSADRRCLHDRWSGTKVLFARAVET